MPHPKQCADKSPAFPASVPGDELKLGIGQPRIAGQPSDGLVPKGVGRGIDPGLLGVFLHNLLHPSGVNLLLRRVWKSQRFAGWAAMWVRRAVANDLPNRT